MNEIDGDDKMEQASNDSDFEDDDNGDDDWFASIFKTLVHDVCFSFYGLKNLNYKWFLGYGVLTYMWIFNVCDCGFVLNV
jgi:hypothetical protein